MQKNQGSVEKSLGLSAPWEISEDDYDRSSKTRRVTLICTDTTELCCPKCSEVCAFYDFCGFRQWRHLDTGTYHTVLRARVPRINCPAHGILTVLVPWASPSSQYTFDFEAEVIGWSQEASISAVAKLLGVGWGAIAGIMERAASPEEGSNGRTHLRE